MSMPPDPNLSPDEADVTQVVTGQPISAAWGASVANDLAELWRDKADNTDLAGKVNNAGGITDLIALTLTAFNAIGTKSPTTLYIITGP